MLILVAGFVAAMTGAPGEARDAYHSGRNAPPPRSCPAVWVRRAAGPDRRADILEEEDAPGQRQVFSVRQVGDLEFVIRYRRKLAAQTVSLKLLTPSGHLYQTLTAIIEPQRLPDRPDVVRLRLPVSGTLIEQSALFGRWQAQTLVAGDSTPCETTLRFVLTR